MKSRTSNPYAICAAIAVATAIGCLYMPSALGQQARSRGRMPAAQDRLPSSLEDRLAAALAKNPDIRAAQSRVQEAEAELNRIRLEVTRKVVAAHHALDAQETKIVGAELRVDQRRTGYQQMVEKKEKDANAASKHQVDQAEYLIEEAELEIVREESELANLEAELRYLLGRFPKGVSQQAGMRALGSFARAAQSLATVTPMLEREAASPMLERIRNPFDQPEHVQLVEQPLEEVLQLLSDGTGIDFVIQPVALAEYDIDPKIPITVSVKNVESLAVALTVIQDLVPGLRFVVRDYGILVTTANGAGPGAILVHDPLGLRKESKSK